MSTLASTVRVCGGVWRVASLILLFTAESGSSHLGEVELKSQGEHRSALPLGLGKTQGNEVLAFGSYFSSRLFSVPLEDTITTFGRSGIHLPRVLCPFMSFTCCMVLGGVV